MVWYFIGVYTINRTLHGRLKIRNFSSHVENIFHEWALQHSKRNFVSLRDHGISSISYKGECQYKLCCYNGAVGECYQLLIKKPVSKLSISWQVKRAAQEHTNKGKATRGRDKDSGLKRSPFPFPSLALACPLQCHSLMASPRWNVYLQAVDYYINFPL